jgi:hypothetical protein
VLLSTSCVFFETSFGGVRRCIFIYPFEYIENFFMWKKKLTLLSIVSKRKIVRYINLFQISLLYHKFIIRDVNTLPIPMVVHAILFLNKTLNAMNVT